MSSSPLCHALLLSLFVYPFIIVVAWNPAHPIGTKGRNGAGCLFSSSDKGSAVASSLTSSPSISPSAHLVFPGGGIFFYWQAGACEYLREAGYDLRQMSMSGASAGALTATLATNDVCFKDATNLALSLAEEAGVWDRSGGLQGIWGPIIERWLDELLPDNAHVKSSESLSLLVTPVPSFGKTIVSQFHDKQDLIKANMASVHLPWFLDGKLVTNFRNRPHIDGSFLAKDYHYLPEHARSQQYTVVTLDWTEDPDMATGFGDFVKLVSKDGIWGMLNQGKTYASDVMEKRGDFKDLPRKMQ